MKHWGLQVDQKVENLALDQMHPAHKQSLCREGFNVGRG